MVRRLFFASAVGLVPLVASAQEELALAFPDASVTEYYATATGTDSYNITPLVDIAVTSLCYYDRNGDGMTQDHQVALYDGTTGEQMALTLVTNASPLFDNFRCEPIEPVVFLAGQPYQMGGYTLVDSVLDWAYAVQDLGVSPSITYDGYVNEYNEDGAVKFVVASPIDIFFFGPNFIITTEIPVPCEGDTSTGDSDEDGICDSDDECEGDDAFPDTDDDGICEDIDECEGDDASPDTDDDGICEDIDPCIGLDNDNDSDDDGICDDLDDCIGTDITGDTDGDGVCDSDDVCDGDDASGDTDSDGVCEDIDPCTGADNGNDADADGVCDDADLCEGDDASGDSDADGHCDDLDCGIDNADRFPGAAELCNGLDDDCDGVLPAGEVDGDGDLVLICGGDCDDGASTVYIDAPELCDDLDNDCDDAIDEDFQDTDDNGVLDCAEVDTDDDGMLPFEGDCDNSNAAVFDGAIELCDGIDNDCDGIIPDEERDGDGDLLSECEGDCDDATATTFNGAPELCDEVDNDCDGAVDEDFEDSNDDGVLDCLEVDADGDGLTPSQGDCNDDDPTVFTGNTESNDGIDNNCDQLLLADELYIAGGCGCSTPGPAPLVPLLPGVLGLLVVSRRRRAY